MTGLVDQWGHPLQKELLTQDVAGPSVTGVRSPYSGYPADGLSPSRLADILREADQGEPLRYYELAETIEERDLHYAGVLATRKRSVAQIDITVEAASDDARDVQMADMIREWLKRDELSDEIFDMMDAVGKQTSFTEIIWDSSMGQWQPLRLEWRDPRWFMWDRKTMRVPQLRGGIDGTAVACDLPAFKFIQTQIKAKSGLPVRSGIARIAAWAWMFKAFTQRDWAIFSQTYGQPVRIGKFHEGATKEDKATLFRAVANIAGDCAAIIPQSMQIEFVEAKNVTAGSDLYEKRADWLDRQISKAILGQTNTTDAQSGGLGSGQAQVHDGVREDIETADCKALSAAINRDLIRPWIDLEYGPQRKYPRVVIARPTQEDLQQLTESLNVLVPLGMRVSASEVRDKFGLGDPGETDELLGAPAKADPAVAPPITAEPATIAAHSQQEAPHPAEQIAAAIASFGDLAIGEMVTSIQSMLDRATDLAEFRAMLDAAFGEIDSTALANALAGGIVAAQAAGRADAIEET
ncbi:MAG: DUF935 domain-containing protein [Novosphingobium sp.]|uniref:DUF935 domain-containing protein n=1 Tax=Novosphingobium sp. TaxID=1874826 RepID=UPI0032BD29C8